MNPLNITDIIAFLIPVGIFISGAAFSFLALHFSNFEIIHKEEIKRHLKDLALFRTYFEM